MMEAKQKTDWESIERSFRAGVLSIREIAKQHAVTEGAIRKKAKGDVGKGVPAWERDLTDKVNAKVRNDLVRTEVRTCNTQDKLRTEREIVESAAATVVQVVREHRRDISRGRDMVSILMRQLGTSAQARDELEGIIDEETKEDSTTQRRAQLMRAVSLPVQAGVLRDLSAAMKNLIPLERQAFNISDGADEPPTPEQATDEDLDRAIAVFAAKAGIGFTPGGKGQEG